MRILLVNNHHENIGGSERYYFELSKLLKSKGHQVAFFSTLDKNNKSSIWERYFIDKINFSHRGIGNFLKNVSRVFYSFASKKKIRLLLNDFKPDIVHIQNIYYYISPSILSEIKKRNIPIIQTIHDYQLITPSINFFHSGGICEITKRNKYYKAFFHKCVKNSYIGSLIAVIASYLQHFFKLYEKNIDYFITPSWFMKKKLIEYGFKKENLIHLPNFINLSIVNSKKCSEEYVLYFGRLLENKGVSLVLEAAKRLHGIEFKIAGNGPEEINLKNITKKAKLKNVEFLGWLSGKLVQKAIKKATFCILPSLWYENCPYSILESFALGKTVIASNIGGIPEIVRDRENGLLFEPGNRREFEKKIRFLWKRDRFRKKLEINAMETIKKKFSAESHYIKLMKIYVRALKVYENSK